VSTAAKDEHRSSVANEPTSYARLAIATLIAVLAAAFVVRLSHLMPQYGTDFDPIRAGARFVLHHRDPYAAIGPGRELFWNYRLLYPMPALVLAMPFVALPIVVARAVFVAVTSGVLAYAIARRSYWPLIVFASAAWWNAVGVAQWSPLLLASAWIPWLGFAIAAKPNVGLAVLAMARSRREFGIAAGVAILLTLLSFVAMPQWVGAWRAATADTPHIRPLVASPLGAPLALAILKWRRPEARLLLVLAIMPINPALYEGVLLFAITRTPIERVLLATTSWLVEPLSAAFAGSPEQMSFLTTGNAMAVCMFLPALFMILQRANVKDSKDAAAGYR
jgi:hypothetical protein